MLKQIFKNENFKKYIKINNFLKKCQAKTFGHILAHV